MSLPAGTRLGPYELSASLGADYPSWSPDGERIYFSVSRKICDIDVLEAF